MSYPSPGDRRDSARIPCESAARLTILKEYGSGADLTVMVSECSGGGMRLESPQEIAPGEAVRIDIGDSLLLGEVVHAAQHASAETARNWTIGIRFEQGIFGLQALQRLLAAITGGDRNPAENYSQSGNARSVHPKSPKSLDQ